MIFAPSVPQSAPPSTNIKCLLVDDVPENLIALEALLQRDDVDILKAGSGAEALELLLQHNDVALALLDVQMPEMNGFELAELIRGSERTRHVPLIFMTAGSRDQNWQFKGYETGAVDFLYKPIDPHMLLSKANVFFELQQQKRAIARELHERTEALRINEMFMAVLSHDLRGPLSAILASTMVLQRPQDTEKVQGIATKIQSIGRRMGRMIEDLLDVTRARQAGGIVIRRFLVDLGTAAQRPVQEIQTSYPERPLEVSQEGDLRGHWDGERLCQVLSNLLGNAIHHGSADQPIELHLDGRDAHTLVMSVSNGGEIEPRLIPYLFDPFRGRERGAGQHQGLGLGLYIVQQLVLAHGGEVQVASEAGRTKFSVRLPRMPASA